MPDLSDLTDLAKLTALLNAQESGKRRAIDEAEMAKALRGRVKGQDHVVDDVSRLIRLQWGKEERKRPIANLLFLGPTGTGKTELAKAMAEYLYEDEKNMLRFDCSEFSGPEAKSRLAGVPSGYVSADKGGQLTRPVLNNPKRLILFDEIEKAYSEVFDLFLQLMGDARLTEQGSGKVADFTQSIIVLTSNAEADAIGKLQAEISDYHEMVNAVKSHLADTKVFRPEIVGRIDRVYVFKPLEGMVIAEIVVLKMSSLAKEYGLELAYVDPHLIIDAMGKGNKLARFGVRELDRVINEDFGEAMYEARQAGGKRVRLDQDDDGGLRISPAN
ncbi:MAG: ATP-dependent Clp protease ATP-binding subunit [Chromatiales bacterium]|nr:ATP-dependent Clp protease ATP-binding subunit [Chromatiales bacterium]